MMARRRAHWAKLTRRTHWPMTQRRGPRRRARVARPGRRPQVEDAATVRRLGLATTEERPRRGVAVWEPDVGLPGEAEVVGRGRRAAVAKAHRVHRVPWNERGTRLPQSRHGETQ
jgi:hypothetical protein